MLTSEQSYVKGDLINLDFIGLKGKHNVTFDRSRKEHIKELLESGGSGFKHD